MCNGNSRFTTRSYARNRTIFYGKVFPTVGFPYLGDAHDIRGSALESANDTSTLLTTFATRALQALSIDLYTSGFGPSYPGRRLVVPCQPQSSWWCHGRLLATLEGLVTTDPVRLSGVTKEVSASAYIHLSIYIG